MIEWIADIVAIMKKDGRVKVCVDYGDLNKAILKDDFPLPPINVLVDRTPKFELFSDGRILRIQLNEDQGGG